jgi:peroxiredoxin
MLIEDGIVASIDIEEPGALEVSSAEYQLAKI